MVIINSCTLPLALRFFTPIAGIADSCLSARSCPELSDDAWLRVGITRTLDDEPSGRAFLQSIRADWEDTPARSSFFDSMDSARRLRFCREANAALCVSMGRSLPDPFAAFSALGGFAVFAGDGHFHAAAVHDAPDADGTKYATGHVYALNLRSHAMHHLDVGDQKDRKKEHDMRTLKRQSPAALRFGTPTGTKVILVWDRAGIDFAWWLQCKNSHGIYFISRPKDNMVFESGPPCSYDAADPVNTGIVADELVAPATHMRYVRRVRFINPLTGETWQVLTNELTLPPGLVVKLYLMRWDIEKVYDEFKNKFLEKKAWASSATAKCMQAVFLCLTHNLMVLHEHELRVEHGITNEAEDRRRAKRLTQEKKAVKKAGRVLPALREALQRCTQRTVKFIRWLRSYLLRDVPYVRMLAALREEYRTL
jgi:hypothetical protein